jgi:hypothetical protein
MMKQSAESIAHRRLMAGTRAQSPVTSNLIGFGIWDFGFKDPPQMKLHKVKSEPQNREYRISNVEGWFRFAQSFL